MSLTPKQEAFVREYLIDLNGTQAAIRAGYSAKGAKVQAVRLLTNANVSAAIAAQKAKRAERTQIDADWLLTRLAEESTADVADLYNEDGTLKPVKDWPLIWRQGLVAGLDVEEIRVEGVVVGSIRKLKLSDRIKRLELIGRHIDVGAFKDKVEHSGKVEVENLTDEALEARIAAYLGSNAA